MPTFEEVVRRAGQTADVRTLQPVVEKELLHHEIIRAMAEAGLLQQLTFIGGTCLRACYGSNRLSEDLDFTGGSSFKADDLRQLGATVRKGVLETYGLEVMVTEPKQDSASGIGWQEGGKKGEQKDGQRGEQKGNVRTWKLQILTHPGSQHLPQQRIHLDICAVRSYEPQPTVLRNHYGVELGTSGLIIQAESKNEILADKMLALALRPNRIKHRDLWDIGWLTQQGESCDAELVWRKCDERGIPRAEFITALTNRLADLPELQPAFNAEMGRFLPQQIVATSLKSPGFWTYLTGAVNRCAQVLVGPSDQSAPSFTM